jgi:hypothetical protein
MSEICVLDAGSTKQRSLVRTTPAAMRLFFTRAPAARGGSHECKSRRGGRRCP